MPCGNSRTIQQINQALREPDNRQDGVIVAKDDLLPYWLEMKVKNNKLTREEADQIWERVNNGSWPASPEARERVEGLMETMLSNASAAMDGGKAVKLMRDFKGLGEFREQVYEGRRYIIFKGNPRVRKVFKGTRYSATNPRILSFGIGRLGVDDALRKGGILTVSLLVPLRIFQYVYDDEKTFLWLAGTLGSDLAKVGINGFITGAAAVATTKISGTIVGGLIVTFAFGIVVGVALDRVDEELGLTSRMINEMEATLETAAESAENQLTRLRQMPCRARITTRRAIDNAIDSLFDSIREYAKRTGKEFVRELIRDQHYPGWFYEVARP